MSETFLEIIAKENIATYFLLPLIQLNKKSFGENNFRNCMVNRNGTVLTVVLADLIACESFETHPEFLGSGADVARGYIYFALPEKWQEDILRYQNGEWSKMSEDAKNMIRDYGGLRYKVMDHDGCTSTDMRLLALDRDTFLKGYWERELGLDERGNEMLSDAAELLSIPPEHTYREVVLKQSTLSPEREAHISTLFQLGDEWNCNLSSVLRTPVVDNLVSRHIYYDVYYFL